MVEGEKLLVLLSVTRGQKGKAVHRQLIGVVNDSGVVTTPQGVHRVVVFTVNLVE